MEAHPELAQVPTIATTTAAELGRQAADMLEVARAYTVDSAEMYALAGEELRTIATRRAQLEEKLQMYDFFRTHKSYLVNLQYVSELEPWFNGAYNLTLKGEGHIRIPVSRTMVKELLKRLEG